MFLCIFPDKMYKVEKSFIMSSSYFSLMAVGNGRVDRRYGTCGVRLIRFSSCVRRV